MPPESSFVTAIRPLISRRSVIATAAGLALSAGRSNSASAQISTANLPDAANVLRQFTPSPVPNLKFNGADGKPQSLADYRGSGLVVNIWATWCGPCIAELPTLVAIEKTLAQSKIRILPISIDLDGAKAVSPYYRSHDITNLPVLLDQDGSITGVLDAPGIPVTVIISADFRLVGRLDGSANWDSPGTIALLRQIAGPKMDNSDTQPA